MSDDDKWSRGNWTPTFNEAQKEPQEVAKPTLGDEGRKPPVHGLQDGPKPPPGIGEAVKAEVRAQEARARAFAKMEKRGEIRYNERVTMEFNYKSKSSGKGIGED